MSDDTRTTTEALQLAAELMAHADDLIDCVRHNDDAHALEFMRMTSNHFGGWAGSRIEQVEQGVARNPSDARHAARKLLLHRCESILRGLERDAQEGEG